MTAAVIRHALVAAALLLAACGTPPSFPPAEAPARAVAPATAEPAAKVRAPRSRAARRAYQRANPCPETGLPTGACPGYVVDHIVPLCAGGADAPENMRWQTRAESHEKDKIEWRHCAALRNGKQ